MHVKKEKSTVQGEPQPQKLQSQQQQPQGGGGGYARPTTSSVTNNVMANIHSGPPPEFDLAYTSPIHPKSDDDLTFSLLELQRNLVFTDALSDHETVWKRELRQVVNAFEYYKLEQKIVLILSHGTTGDHFYISTEGSVQDYDMYQLSSSSSSSGSGSSKTWDRGPGGVGNCIGIANKPGQSFGELFLLYNCPPSADCLSWGERPETWVYP